MMLLNDHGPCTSTSRFPQSADRTATSSVVAGVGLTAMGGSGLGQHKRPKWKRHRGGEWRLRPGTILQLTALAASEILRMAGNDCCYLLLR